MIRLIEDWKTSLDKNLFTGAVLMDLSKAFDFIPHNLLISKLHAYGLSFDTVTFLNLYLKDRKQNVRINNIFSAFQNFYQVYHKLLYKVRSFSIYFSMTCFYALKSQTYIILPMIIPSLPLVTLSQDF